MQPAPDLEPHVIAADVGAAVAGDRVRLVVDTPEGGDCAWATGVVTERGVTEGGGVAVGLLDAVLAGWLSPGGPVRTSAAEILPCEGLPPVDALVIPVSGWAIGLRRPASAPAVEGPFRVAPMGTDGRWWHVIPAGDGAGAIGFLHDDAPPTRFAVKVDARLVGRPSEAVPVARGGAAVLDLPGELSYVSVLPPETVEVHAVGASLVVLGRAPGTADGVMRVGTLDPEPLRIEVGAPVASSRGEVLVPRGGKRRFLVEREVRAVWVGAPETLAVELRGRRLVLSGLAPGRTEIVLQDDTGALVTVPIAVGG